MQVSCLSSLLTWSEDSIKVEEYIRQIIALDPFSSMWLMD